MSVLGAYDTAVKVSFIKTPHHGGNSITPALPVTSASEVLEAADEAAAGGALDRVAALSGRLDRLSPEDRAAIKREVDDMLGPDDS